MAASQIRAAVQAMLDDLGDGWKVDQLVICMGLERIGRVESTPWLWAPPDQPEWQTDGLLAAAVDMRDTADIDD